MAYSRQYPQSITPKGTSVQAGFENDDKEIKRILDILSKMGALSLAGTKRQSVLYGPTDANGAPNFLVATGLSISIDGSSKPIIFAFANGFSPSAGSIDLIDKVDSLVSSAWTLPPNQTCYLYIDKDKSTGLLSFGYTTAPDLYLSAAPASPVLDQHYFNTVEMKMYRYNSNSWEEKLRVFVGKAVTASSSISINQYIFTSRVPVTGSIFTDYVKKSGDTMTGQLVASAGIKGDLNGISDAANALRTIDANGVRHNSNFNWIDKVGQPSWLWGGSDPNNMYVYNPSNFNVNHAITATKLAATIKINDVAFDGSSGITIVDSTKLPLTGGTLSGNLVFDDSAEIKLYGANRNCGLSMYNTGMGLYDWANNRNIWRYTQADNIVRCDPDAKFSHEVYANGWFRTTGDNGWLSEKYGGGWYMQDTNWIRAYGNKSVWTSQKMQADGGFYGSLHGTADNATNAYQLTPVYNCTIKGGGGDISPKVGGAPANIEINSWYGVSFTSNCGDGGAVPNGKTAVGIDCRNGIVRAMSFEGALHGTADNATHAGTADNATHAGTADNATHAGTADNATHAGTADNATHAGTADNANALNGYTAAQLLERNNVSVVTGYMDAYVGAKMPIPSGYTRDQCKFLASIKSSGGGDAHFIAYNSDGTITKCDKVQEINYMVVGIK